MPCPFAFLIKPEMFGTIVSASHGESAYGVELVMHAFGYRAAELNSAAQMSPGSALYGN